MDHVAQRGDRHGFANSQGMWQVAVLLAVVIGVYGLALFRLYRSCPSVRARLEAEVRPMPALAAAEGYERIDATAGSVLVPVEMARPKKVTNSKKQEAVLRSEIRLRHERGVATIQLVRHPRRMRVGHGGRFWGRVVDTMRTLEKALSSRFGYGDVVMRSVLLRGQTDVRLGRIRLGPLQGFVREGRLHDTKGAAGARVWQCDLFDEAWHYKVDVMSVHDCLAPEQVAAILGSFRPPG